MKKYDVNIKFGIATIRVYLQVFEFRGFYDIEIQGNVNGSDYLESAIEADLYEQNDIKNSDCEMKIFENKEGYTCISCVLKDRHGNTLEIDEDIDTLPEYIVGCHIIDYKESE